MLLSYTGDRTRNPAGPQTVYRCHISNRHRTSVPESILDSQRSQEVFNHSPDGFQWGYSGSGPAQLALAILLDVTDDEETSVRLHQAFKRDKIASLGDRFVLTFQEVRDWLDSQAVPA